MYINNKEHGDNNIFKIVQDLKLENPNAYSGAVYMMARMLGVHSTSVYSSCDQEDTDKLCMAIILQRNPRYRLNRANKFVIDFFKRYTLEDVRNNFYISKSKPRWVIKEKKNKQVELIPEASVDIKPIEEPVPLLRRINNNNRRRFIAPYSKPATPINNNNNELINMDKLKQLIAEIVDQRISKAEEGSKNQFVVPVGKNSEKSSRKSRFLTAFTAKNIKSIFNGRASMSKAEFVKAFYNLAYDYRSVPKDVYAKYFSDEFRRLFGKDDNIMKYYRSTCVRTRFCEINYYDLINLSAICQRNIANKRITRIAA